MSLVECENPDVVTSSPIRLGSQWEGLLVQGFGVQFTIFDGETGELASVSPDQPKGDCQNWSEPGTK